MAKSLSLDDSVMPSGLLDDAGWDLKLSPSEAALGVSLALKLLLMDSAQQPALLDVFDEKYGAVGSDSSTWERAADVPLGSIFFTVCQLSRALEIADDSGILIHALLLIERLIRRFPGVLRGSTLRPLLLTAISLSSKSYHDEQLSDIVCALKHFGIETVTADRLLELEVAFLERIDWRISSPRQTYASYIFELRSLVASQIHELADHCPDLVGVARSLDIAQKNGERPDVVLHDRKWRWPRASAHLWERGGQGSRNSAPLRHRSVSQGG